MVSNTVASPKSSKNKKTAFKPLLAGEAPDKIKFPVYASAKLDGIRGTVFDKQILSRSLKEIPNRFIQKFFYDFDHNGLDGELIVGQPNAKDVFRVTTSAVMSEDGEPDFSFYVFDSILNPDAPFHERYQTVLDHPGPGGRIVVLPQKLVVSEAELFEYEKEALALGYEGLVLRSPQGHYKFGRSTSNEGIMMKLKRFTDSEARIVGMEEEMHNANEAKKNELGETERSSHKENLVGKGTMGALVVEELKTGRRFNIGTGFTAADRKWFWTHREDLIHDEEIVKFKYFEIGEKDLPRHPVYLGFRDKRDMS